jgi:CheY-like chemotaxis protein
MLGVLVVEDSEPWRRFISSIVEKDPQLHIACEVSDGLEAVRKAEELKRGRGRSSAAPRERVSLTPIRQFASG